MINKSGYVRTYLLVSSNHIITMNNDSTFKLNPQSNVLCEISSMKLSSKWFIIVIREIHLCYDKMLLIFKPKLNVMYGGIKIKVNVNTW